MSHSHISTPTQQYLLQGENCWSSIPNYFLSEAQGISVALPSPPGLGKVSCRQGELTPGLQFPLHWSLCSHFWYLLWPLRWLGSEGSSNQTGDPESHNMEMSWQKWPIGFRHTEQNLRERGLFFPGGLGSHRVSPNPKPRTGQFESYTTCFEQCGTVQNPTLPAMSNVAHCSKASAYRTRTGWLEYRLRAMKEGNLSLRDLCSRISHLSDFSARHL